MGSLSLYEGDDDILCNNMLKLIIILQCRSFCKFYYKKANTNTELKYGRQLQRQNLLQQHQIQGMHENILGQSVYIS